MSLLTINIGLDSPRHTTAENAARVALWMRQVCPSSSLWIGRANWGEQTIIAHMWLPTWGRESMFDKLCEDTGQDCVAVLGAQWPNGVLLGPYPERYRPFQASKFLTQFSPGVIPL